MISWANYQNSLYSLSEFSALLFKYAPPPPRNKCQFYCSVIFEHNCLFQPQPQQPRRRTPKMASLTPSSRSLSSCSDESCSVCSPKGNRKVVTSPAPVASRARQPTPRSRCVCWMFFYQWVIYINFRMLSSFTSTIKTKAAWIMFIDIWDRQDKQNFASGTW